MTKKSFQDQRQSLPSLLALVHLEAVVDSGSFSHAARRLHVTQSAVSRQIRSLEESLELTLFERTHTGVRPTPAALAIAQSVRQGLGGIATTLDRWRPNTSTPHPRGITLGITPSLGTHWLSTKLTAFRSQHPGWRLQPDIAISMHDLKSSSVDACLRYGLGGYTNAMWQCVSKEVFVAVCAPALWENSLDLSSLPLLQAFTPSSPRGEAPLVPWQKAHGGVLKGRVQNFNRQAMAIEAAIQGEGVAIVPKQMVKASLKQGSLIQPVPTQCDDHMAYYLVWDDTASEPEVITLLSQWLSQEMRA